jgi:hypothetical protein
MPNYRSLNVSELTPGSVSATPIFDSQFTKLLEAGTTIDQHLIDRLVAMGITEVAVESAAESVVRQRTKPLPLPSGVRVGATEQRPPPLAIDQCSSCGKIIGLHPPAPNSKAGAWICKTCGAVYFGSDEEGTEACGVERRELGLDNPFIAPVEIKAGGAASSVPPGNVQRLLRSLVTHEFDGPERRAHKRHPVSVPVTVLPLAADFRIDGEPIQMTTANISLGGVALIHTRFIDAPYLALDFTVAGVELLQVVLKVLRVRSVGPVYEIGGQFISRLSQPPK